MNLFYQKLLSPEAWLIKEKHWEKNLQNVRESQFAQGNGYLGLRGILEETPYNAVPGTYLAGLYDHTNAQETELVNLPNPVHLKLTSGGEKLGAVAMDQSKHIRFLDMRQGLLTRHTLYQDVRKRKYDYQSMRFVSMRDKNFIVMRTWLTPLESDAEITVKTDTDISTSNAGVITEGRKRHYQVVKVAQFKKYNYLCVKTLEKEILVAYLSHLTYSIGKRTFETTDHAFRLKIKKGRTVCFTKVICLVSSTDKLEGPLEKHTTKKMDWAVKQGFEALLERHSNAMKRLWQFSDIKIKGDAESQQLIRFNIYHMLICAPQDDGRSSVGAKTLSGEGYRGHIFWDTEIFLFPFYLFTQPDKAKNILLYRYYRLDAARKIALRNGYRGAQFPWESSDTGEESTPSWAKNFDGKVIAVKTGRFEHHIVSDIAYACYHYYQATQDIDFMLEYGLELFLETARFWASRGRYDKKTRRFRIRHVIGPDEFHEDIHDNAYTNMMAKWNLLAAYRLFFEFKRRYPAALKTIQRNIRLERREVQGWRQTASGIIPSVRKDGVIEQFQGYFKKKPVRITQRDKFGMPDFPVGLDLSLLNKTQFLKQADVIMLLYLLSTLFSLKTKKCNYQYYAARTLHKSSLSPSVHAILAAETGRLDESYHYFQIASAMDFKNIYGNTDSGIHAACLGGAWQVIVNGFAGLRIKQKRLCFSPKLPPVLREIRFTLMWQGCPLFLRITHRNMRFYYKSKEEKTAALSIQKNNRTLKPNQWQTVRLRPNP